MPSKLKYHNNYTELGAVYQLVLPLIQGRNNYCKIDPDATFMHIRLSHEKCTRAKGNKRLYISKNFLEKRQESYDNILSEKGILYRMNRSIQVEGAFGVLKNDYEFQRFLLRGKTKVKLEILSGFLHI